MSGTLGELIGDSMAELPIAYMDFTFLHKVCGARVWVKQGQEQPHRCRIDLDAQRRRY